MKSRQLFGVSTIVKTFAVLACFLITGAVQAGDSADFQVLGGAVKFLAVTNISALTIHGQSNQMTATLRLHKEGNSINVENVQARIDPKTFTTGMSLRDQHLHKKVFALDNGTMPELKFTSDKLTCPDVPASRDVSCPASGQMTLRGVTRPFEINLQVINDGKGYRITAAGALKLSTFGIERPCQLGVCVTDEVKLNLQFNATEGAVARAGGYQ